MKIWQVSPVAGSLVVVIGVYLDSWWHLAIGRENFWIPPHLVIYVGFALIVLTAIATMDMRLTLILVPIVIAGPLDDYYHNAFLGGRPEGNLTLQAAWSPPHLWAELWAIILFVFLAKRLIPQDSFLATLEFGALFTAVTIPLGPFLPDTPFRVGGPFGLAFVTAVGSIVLFGASTILRHKAMTIMTFVYLVANIPYFVAPPALTLRPLNAFWPLVVAVSSLLPVIMVENFFRVGELARSALTAGAVRAFLTWLIWLPYTSVALTTELGATYVAIAIPLATVCGGVGAFLGWHVVRRFLGNNGEFCVTPQSHAVTVNAGGLEPERV